MTMTSESWIVIGTGIVKHTGDVAPESMVM